MTNETLDIDYVEVEQAQSRIRQAGNELMKRHGLHHYEATDQDLEQWCLREDIELLNNLEPGFAIKQFQEGANTAFQKRLASGVCPIKSGISISLFDIVAVMFFEGSEKQAIAAMNLRQSKSLEELEIGIDALLDEGATILWYSHPTRTVSRETRVEVDDCRNIVHTWNPRNKLGQYRSDHIKMSLCTTKGHEFLSLTAFVRLGMYSELLCTHEYIFRVGDKCQIPNKTWPGLIPGKIEKISKTMVTVREHASNIVRRIPNYEFLKKNTKRVFPILSL